MKLLKELFEIYKPCFETPFKEMYRAFMGLTEQEERARNAREMKEASKLLAEGSVKRVLAGK